MADRDIPDQLVWAYDSGRRPKLRRELEPTERSALEARANDLRRALAPWPPSSRNDLIATIGEMLGAFPTMQRYSAEEALGMSIAYLESARNSNDAPFPHWAIVRACDLIRRGEAGIERSFCPPEPVFVSVVRNQIGHYKRQLAEIEAILNAPVPERRAEPEPRPMPKRRGLPPPLQGERASALKADLEARKARNQAQQQEDRDGR
jgi:hypothetical protein